MWFFSFSIWNIFSNLSQISIHLNRIFPVTNPCLWSLGTVCQKVNEITSQWVTQMCAIDKLWWLMSDDPSSSIFRTQEWRILVTYIGRCVVCVITFQYKYFKLLVCSSQQVTLILFRQTWRDKHVEYAQSHHDSWFELFDPWWKKERKGLYKNISVLTKTNTFVYDWIGREKKITLKAQLQCGQKLLNGLLNLLKIVRSSKQCW